LEWRTSVIADLDDCILRKTRDEVFKSDERLWPESRWRATSSLNLSDTLVPSFDESDRRLVSLRLHWLNFDKSRRLAKVNDFPFDLLPLLRSEGLQRFEPLLGGREEVICVNMWMGWVTRFDLERE
jgi:hypothetical protein